MVRVQSGGRSFKNVGLVDDLLVDTLSDEQREDLAQIHPSFRGGEFLPPYAAQELEIARIELQSSTWDVISVRARRADDTIYYSICDEYASQFELCPPLSNVPLTLGELIDLIDHAGEQESLGLRAKADCRRRSEFGWFLLRFVQGGVRFLRSGDRGSERSSADLVRCP